MSSSEPGPLSKIEAFVADVETVGASTFVSESAVRTPVADAAPEPTPLPEYDPTPSEDELRAMLQMEMQDELRAEIQRQRGEDAAAFEELARDLRGASERRLDLLARRATELAMLVAERLIRDRVEHDPQVVERALRDALREIDAGTGATVYAHPEDAAYLRAQTAVLEELGVAAVVDDPKQRRGGCLIDVGQAGWDRTVVTQMATLQQAVDAILESS